MKYHDDPLGPVITFIIWISLLVVICIIGISNVFAAEYNLDSNYIQVYYDNNGSSVTSVGQTWVESLQSYISNNITTTAGSYGAGVAFNSPIPILANHNYSISIFFPELNNIALSSKNKITIGNSASSVSYNYTHNDYWVTQNYSNISNNSIISYNFTANGDASYIFIPWTTTTTTTQDYFFNQIIIEDLGSEGVSEATINNSINNQTNILNNYIQSSTNTITGALTDTENNINSNIDDMEQTIVDGNKETQEVIKDQFNTCRDSYNLFNENIYTNSSTNGYSLKNLEVGKNYTISINNNPNNSNYGFLIKDGAGSALTSDMWEQYTNKSVTFTYTQAMYDNDYKLYIIDTVNYAPISVDTLKSLKIQLQKGTTALDYDPYGEKVCTNKIDDTNSKLDEQNETSKGILGKLKDLVSYINPFSENFFVYKLIELLIDALKSLFIPEDNFFTEWWNDFKMYIDLKLGFLTTPFEIFINFINSYLDLSEDNIIIDIPEITVPNFEDHVIIEAQTFNWKELLESKASLNTLWQLYLDFIDVYLILNFLGLCNNTYARIFGGDTSNYEYYTVEDSYYFDTSTGEVSNSGKHSERTVRRKRV